LRLDAWLQMTAAGPAKAVQTYEDSVWAALEGRRDDVAVESASTAMGIAGYHLGKPDAAARWERLGWALLKRMGAGHDRLLAYFYHWRAVARQRSDLKAALDDAFKALELTRKVTSAYSLETSDLVEAIGSMKADDGDLPGAVDFANHALDGMRRCCGEQNPRLGHPLAMRGEALARLGRLVEGERDLRRAIEMFNQMGGGIWHLWSTYPMTALGKDLMDQHRPAEAARTLERALAIREQSEPNPEMVAETRFALARALWDEGVQRARALSLAGQARSAYAKTPQGAADLSDIDRWMAGKEAL
jgi:tetratricopeptide (TPR) repeat protein